jgi:hypothetical protein
MFTFVLSLWATCSNFPLSWNLKPLFGLCGAFILLSKDDRNQILPWSKWYLQHSSPPLIGSLSHQLVSPFIRPDFRCTDIVKKKPRYNLNIVDSGVKHHNHIVIVLNCRFQERPSSYMARFQMHWDSKILLHPPP